MTVRNIDEIRKNFEVFIEARSNLLDSAQDACFELGQYPNMINMWQVVLFELFGMEAGLKAVDLSAGLMQVAEQHIGPPE